MDVLARTGFQGPMLRCPNSCGWQGMHLPGGVGAAWGVAWSGGVLGKKLQR